MKAALIGAGHIARQHLACLEEVDGVQVTAVCDLSPAVAESAAERHRVPAWFSDHRVMLETARPDVVHITTPPTSHHRLGVDALEAGAHVLVEKPAAATLEELTGLVKRARALDRVLVEDHNYLFNRAIRTIDRRLAAGAFGAVVHVEVLVCSNILEPVGFADPNVPHPVLALPGGAITDFLPHLASIACHYLGPHRRAHAIWSKRARTVLPHDELHAVVECELGTASLGFSAGAQPDAFWVRVHGERMQATANLWTTRLTFDRLRPGARQLRSFLNGFEEARAIRRGAVSDLVGKLRGGRGSYDGLWELIRRTYRALADQSTPPVTVEDVIAVNRLVDALKPREHTT